MLIAQTPAGRAKKKTLGLSVDRVSLPPFALLNALGFLFYVMG